ncbi:MAG: hypothetical protein FJ280_18835 [Planctomycetes bacterium]|nr:hypothetical protein [Planctomycetota bacterium]
MPYNWPSKVRRYGITDACQRFLVAKYESIIDWNGDRIESPDALDRHIREKMLPRLHRRMEPDSPDSHYCRASGHPQKGDCSRYSSQAN